MTFEAKIIETLQKLSTPFFDKLMAFMSFFSDYMIVVVFFLFLFFNRERMLAFYFLLTELISTLIQFTAKKIFLRPRPYVQYSEIKGIFNASGTSFPSGHSVTAMCVFVFILLLIYKSNPSKRDKFVFITLGVLYLIFNAFNRMYLGQHFISDIIGGYLLEIAIGGIAFLLYNPFKELYNLIENTICKPRRVYNNDKKGEEKTDIS